MSKFSALSPEAHRTGKRQKLEDGTASSRSGSQEISQPAHLRALLGFHQAAGSDLRGNLLLVKFFLEAIVYGEESIDREAKRTVLLNYLQTEVPKEDDRSSVYLVNLIQIWSFAAQSNDDGLLSAVPALLALLFKTISTLIEFRDHGIRLCKTLLRKDQVKLLDRGLTANKTKEHLISPCLRLLTEIVSFDGGSSAQSVYLHRAITFKRLEIFLRLKKPPSGTTARDKHKPSVRSNATRYLLANFRLQDQLAKADILTQGKYIRALLEDICYDPPEAIKEILDVLKKSAVLDEALPRIAKSRLLTDWALCRIAALYGYEEDDIDPGKSLHIESLAHAFLLCVCTTPNGGVLVSQHGWYPPGLRTRRTSTQTDMDFAETEGMPHDKYVDRVPIQNTTLAMFLQSLRPYANPLHRDLALAIFEAAPELIADYFFRKRNFSFDPKLSATWIGYSTFLFSVVNLPLPSQHESGERSIKLPPPTSIVMESILPQPLNQKSLSKCLYQSTGLITYFAVRLMIIAFQKLENVLSSFSNSKRLSGDLYSARWEQASVRLRSEFCLRCPEMKHVITVFRSCSGHNVLLRESTSLLLAMYYKVIPQIALYEKFDISIALSEALSALEPGNQDNEDSRMCLLDLDHLLDISYRSPDMRWWYKPENMSICPFSTILRLCVNTNTSSTKDTIKNLLKSIVRDNAILQQATDSSPLDALLASLGTFGDWKSSNAVYEFLDNCVVRLVRKPIKYYGDAADFAGVKLFGVTKLKASSAISLLWMVILEQWPFLVCSTGASDLVTVASWLGRWLDFSGRIGEDDSLLLCIRNQLKEDVRDTDCRLMLERAVSKSWQTPLPHTLSSKATILRAKSKEDLQGPGNASVSSTGSYSDEILFTPPLQETEDYPGLSRWNQKEIDEVVEDGALGELLACLCSRERHIRSQAILNLTTLMGQLEVSGYIEWQQLYVLLGEVIETARDIDDALPFFAGVLAARCVKALADPLNYMYQKINKFLNKNPRWNTSKLPSYWAEMIFLYPPADDDAHHREVEWLLDLLVDGLQTQVDMELYRRCHVMERTLSIAASPSLPRSCISSILRLVSRCTYLEGSTTLITRCGILSWIQSCIAQRKYEGNFLKKLALQIYQTSDQARIAEWSSGTITDTVNTLIRI